MRPRPNMLVGGRAIVCPCIQMVQRIPLSTMTLIIESPRVYTSQGVPISVTGVAQVDRQPTYVPLMLWLFDHKYRISLVLLQV